MKPKGKCGRQVVSDHFVDITKMVLVDADHFVDVTKMIELKLNPPKNKKD